MKRKLIGIDFGSSNTRVYSPSLDSVVYNEPTCVAIDTVTKNVFETGFLANKIMGKSPYNYQIIRPLIQGAVADVEASVAYLSKAISDAKTEHGFSGYGIVFSAPSQMTRVNQNALVEIGKRLQAKEIYLESQAKLAALGAGENIYSPCATLVCNIGSGIADIACISMGEVVSSTTCLMSGDAIDEAIRRYMIEEKHISIGKKTAQSIKLRIGNVYTINDGALTEVKGKDTITSLPTSAIVSASEIKRCLTPLISFLTLKIKDVIFDLEPELASDLIQSGLLLTGGGAMLMGLRDYLQNALSIPVRIVDNPQNAVINGIKMYIKKIDEAKN